MIRFTEDILKKIIQMGSRGYSPARISLELNITIDELRDQMIINKLLKNAIDRAEYNADQYILGKIKDGSSQLSPTIQKVIYERLTQKYDKGNDNEIIIRRV